MDLCRARIVFDRVADLRACLEAIRDDPAAQARVRAPTESVEIYYQYIVTNIYYQYIIYVKYIVVILWIAPASRPCATPPPRGSLPIRLR